MPYPYSSPPLTKCTCFVKMFQLKKNYMIFTNVIKIVNKIRKQKYKTHFYVNKFYFDDKINKSLMHVTIRPG